MASAFCPQCGTARTGPFRFCRSCGLDFEGLPAAAEHSLAPPRAAPVTPAAALLTAGNLVTYRLLALIAWMGSALFLGWLALLQLSDASASRLNDGTLTLLAAWNLLMAALVVYGAIRIHRSVRRSSYASAVR